MEVIKSAGSGSLGSNYFADPFVLELLVSGFVGSNLKARIAIHEFVDKQLLLARDEETRLQGQLGVAQKRRQELEMMNSLLDLFDSQMSENATTNSHRQTILTEITKLSQRAKTDVPDSVLTVDRSNSTEVDLELSPAVTTQIHSTQFIGEISSQPTQKHRKRSTVKGKTLPTAWRLIQEKDDYYKNEVEKSNIWNDFHARESKRSGNRLSIRLQATGQLIRPFIPCANMVHNPALVCGCSLTSIYFGFLVIGKDTSSYHESEPILEGRYCLNHVPAEIEVQFVNGTKKISSKRLISISRYI